MDDEGDENLQDALQHTIGVGTSATRATTYSGTATAIQKGGLGTQTGIMQDLLWQRSVGGGDNKDNSVERNHGESTGFQGLPVCQTRELFRNGNALADEVRGNKGSYQPSSWTNHWICWRQNSNEGTHTNPALPVQDVGMGKRNGFIGRTGYVQILRRRPVLRRHSLERGGGRQQSKKGTSCPKATLNPIVVVGSN